MPKNQIACTELTRNKHHLSECTSCNVVMGGRVKGGQFLKLTAKFTVGFICLMICLFCAPLLLKTVHESMYFMTFALLLQLRLTFHPPSPK